MIGLLSVSVDSMKENAVVFFFELPVSAIVAISI